MLSYNRRRFATFRSRSLRPAPALCYIIPIFIPRCAGASRHGRLVRKHVPDYDPGCARQSTSMPALHRRILPNCSPMVHGGMKKCSAVEDFARRGACPPLGSGWGVAETAAPIRCTKPQLRPFITSCAGGGRHEQLIPIRGTSQTHESRSFRRDPSLPAPQLVALCSLQSRLTTPTKLAAQLGERSFPLFHGCMKRICSCSRLESLQGNIWPPATG